MKVETDYAISELCDLAVGSAFIDPAGGVAIVIERIEDEKISLIISLIQDSELLASEINWRVVKYVTALPNAEVQIHEVGTPNCVGNRTDADLTDTGLVLRGSYRNAAGSDKFNLTLTSRDKLGQAFAPIVRFSIWASAEARKRGANPIYSYKK